eukprot:6184730-Pleurochrysis_carterae.AAC.1
MDYEDCSHGVPRALCPQRPVYILVCLRHGVLHYLLAWRGATSHLSKRQKRGTLTAWRGHNISKGITTSVDRATSMHLATPVALLDLYAFGV